MIISLINKGDLKSHFNESKKKLGLWHPVFLLKKASDDVNSYTFYLGVIITSKAMGKLNPKEQYAVIDHELGHIKNFKADLILFVYILSPAIFIYVYNNLNIKIYATLFIFIILFLRVFKLKYIISLKRKSELKADGISAKIGNPMALISALIKMNECLKEKPRSKSLKFIYWLYFSNCPFYPSVEERIKKLKDFSYKDISTT